MVIIIVSGDSIRVNLVTVDFLKTYFVLLRSIDAYSLYETRKPLATKIASFSHGYLITPTMLYFPQLERK